MVVDGADASAGTLNAGTNSGVQDAGIGEYIGHTSVDGVTGWDFSWDSPATDVGPVTFYYCYRIYEAPTESEIYIGNLSLSSPLVGLGRSERLEDNYSVSFNQQLNQLNIGYYNPDKNRIIVHVQDLNGRVVAREDLGYKAPGEQTETMNLNTSGGSSFYIVSVLIGNHPVSKKVYIGS